MRIVVVNERGCLVKLRSIQHPLHESYSIIRSHDGGLTSVVTGAYHLVLMKYLLQIQYFIAWFMFGYGRF